MYKPHLLSHGGGILYDILKSEMDNCAVINIVLIKKILLKCYYMIDNFNLQRFEDAHRKYHQTALSEIKTSKKQSYRMWYIFPQLKGSRKSSTSDYYGISKIDEAKAYLSHPILRKI